MEQSSQDSTATLLKNLLERFESLEDVKTLKDENAHRSASASTSEAEASAEDDEPASVASEGPKAKAGRKTAKSRHRSSGTRGAEDQSRSRRRRRQSRRETSPHHGDGESSASLSRSTQRQSRKGKSPVQSLCRSWADCMSDPESEEMNYTEVVSFSEAESEDHSHIKVVEMSERTVKFLQEKCTRRVPNSERKDIRDRYPLPKVPATRPAQLDPMMKSETSSAIKATDKQLARVQTLLLDSLAPLTSILEAHHNGDILDQKEMVHAVKSGMQLIGNANAHLLHLRRERVVSNINKALLPVVGDDKNFKEAAPLLFGTKFAKKGKEMVEQVKAMRSTLHKKPERKPPFFRGGPPSAQGGSSRRFGRGGTQSFRYRERPYLAGKGQTQTKRTQN